MMNIIDLIGRILLSILFLLNGFFKINNYENTVEWMEGFGMSGLFIIPAIIIEILGSILIIVGYKTKFAAAFLSLFCIITAIIFHNDFDSSSEMTAFLKNIALAGGFLIIFAHGPKKYSIDKKINN